MNRRGWLSLTTLAFCAGTIWWLLVYGRTGNVLHDSAMSWSWTLGTAILALQKGLEALPGIILSFKGAPVPKPTEPPKP
jgi:hypothetical protein